MLFLSLSSDHWDYHPHSHVHPVEFENLQEANFTELQSVQTLHAPSLLRHDVVRYDADNLLDPNLGAHPHVLQQPVSPSAAKPYIEGMNGTSTHGRMLHTIKIHFNLI